MNSILFLVMSRSWLMQTAKVKKKKEQFNIFCKYAFKDTFSFKGILINLCHIVQQKQKRKRGFVKFKSFLLPWLC